MTEGLLLPSRGPDWLRFSRRVTYWSLWQSWYRELRQTAVTPGPVLTCSTAGMFAVILTILTMFVVSLPDSLQIFSWLWLTGAKLYWLWVSLTVKPGLKCCTYFSINITACKVELSDPGDVWVTPFKGLLCEWVENGSNIQSLIIGIIQTKLVQFTETLFHDSDTPRKKKHAEKTNKLNLSLVCDVERVKNWFGCSFFVFVSFKPALDFLLALKISCEQLHYLRDYEMHK